jgi:hypothetical protein
MKAIKRKNLRMRISMHANPQRAKAFGRQKLRLVSSPSSRPEMVVFLTGNLDFASSLCNIVYDTSDRFMYLQNIKA